MFSFICYCYYYSTILPQIIEVKNKKLKVHANTLTIGVEDISIFPELENQYEFLKTTQGLNLTFVLKNSKSKRDTRYLFSGLKIPV